MPTTAAGDVRVSRVWGFVSVSGWQPLVGISVKPLGVLGIRPRLLFWGALNTNWTLDNNRLLLVVRPKAP
jgi:hypothetical protein